MLRMPIFGRLTSAWKFSGAKVSRANVPAMYYAPASSIHASLRCRTKIPRKAAIHLAPRFFKLYRESQRKLGVPDDRFLVATHFDDIKPIKARVAAADAAK